MNADDSYLLNLDCPDQVGIVAEVSSFLAAHGCNITESAQFDDQLNDRFFMRVAFTSTPSFRLEDIRTAFSEIGERFSMNWHVVPRHLRMRTLILVSKFGHCLNDLVFRRKIGALPIDLKGVVSNHETFRSFCQANEVPFTHIPVTPETKAASERQLIDMIEAEGIELVILARYMQVLSDDLCSRYPGRIINIHHSLLPSFKGAKPYHRAHERGVKMIGATAHYVTADLDEGPIIEQGVARVRHNMTPDDLVAKGREIETLVLSAAVQAHAERRVFLNGLRTVVF